MHSSVITFVFLGCFTLAQFPTISVLCYWCNPEFQAESCSNPEESMGRTNCSLQLAGDDISNWTISCFSSFRFSNNVSLSNLTGIYRGCSSHRRIHSFCDRPVRGMTQVSCAACETDACNTHSFDDAGNIIENSSGEDGPISSTAAISYLHFGLMILLLPNYF
ncbi:hypothetical protein HUJ05_010101 [Dendroctonus ponderosae]|nr:hypothetical protein HUJ05_010101 [Dendroctonus ponderosae]